jgi:hypothetical protein
MIRGVPAFLLTLTLGVPVAAQTNISGYQAQTPAAATDWTGTAALYAYLVPEDEEDFVTPILAADRDWLHLEARFNYEDFDTASLWAGRKFTVGTRVALEITPMAGVVLGNTDGAAIGYTGSLTWRTLDLFSESEYVFAAGDDGDFVYTWSELGWTPVRWFRGGLALQRTKIFGGESDTRGGFFGSVLPGPWELSAYVFNPGDSPTLMFGVAYTF